MVLAYQSAEVQVLMGKSVSIASGGNSRSLTLENLNEIRAGRVEWERKAAALAQASGRAPTFGGTSYSVSDFSGGRHSQTEFGR